MACFNAADTIGKAIKSVQMQTYMNWELIAVNDCSQDGTSDFLTSLSDDRIKVLENKANLGASQSRNLGVASASGNWIVVLDADDFLSPSYLTKL